MSTVVPVIYSIRSTLNENKSLEDQTDAVADALLRLERIHSGFDDLDLVKGAKELFSDLLVQSGTDISVKSHLHGKGFEPIKRELIEKHIRGISHPESLVDYTFKEPASKKQKSGGFSYAFDFDNMPMFESFESILSCIRADPCDMAALEKMMAMDLSELVDHHQWEEALSLLHKSLIKASEARCQLLLLAMLHRFVVGFVGTGQGLDTINCALRYLFAQWVLPATTASAPLSPESKTIARAQLALFVTILRCSASSLQVPYQKEADRAIVFIFYILGKGKVHVPPAVGNASAVASVSREVSALQALTYTSESGAAITSLLRSVHPFTALSYAVETGLLSQLLQQMHVEDSINTHALVERSLKLQIVLALVTLFGTTHNQAVAFIEQCSGAGDSARSKFWKYEWQGDLRLLDAPPVTGRDKADILVPVEGTNKRFLHLKHTASVWSALQENCLHGDGSYVGSASLLCWLAWQLEVVHAGVAALAPGEHTSHVLQRLELGTVLQGSAALCTCYCHSTSAQCVGEIASVMGTCGALMNSALSVCGELESSIVSGYANGLWGLISAAPSNPEQAGHLAAAALGQVQVRGALEHPCPLKDAHALQRTLLSLLLAYIEASAGAGAVRTELLSCALKFSQRHLQAIVDVEPTSPGADVTNGGDLSTAALCVCILQAVLSGFADAVSPVDLLAACRVLVKTPIMSSCDGFQSGNARSRTIFALSTGMRKLSPEHVISLFQAHDVRSPLVETLVAEYRHADCFDRAYEGLSQTAAEPAEPQDAFSAVFSLLTSLVQQGHHAIAGGLLAQGWGTAMDLPDMTLLQDLPRLHAEVLCRTESAAQLECECVFAYLLRLLFAGLRDPAYSAAVRAHSAELAARAHLSSDERDGMGAVTVFCVLSRRLLGEPLTVQESQWLTDPAFRELSSSLFPVNSP